MSRDSRRLCPSAQPDWEGSAIIGVVHGTAEAPALSFLDEPIPVTDEVLALSHPVTPTEVFRIAAPCMCSGCVHYTSGVCRLASRVVKALPVVTNSLPACGIRPECRWWRQEGEAACLRCPQVVTDNFYPSEQMRDVADPTSRIA
jgi:hypothetical protein